MAVDRGGKREADKWMAGCGFGVLTEQMIEMRK